jgi:heat shock protein HslJ
MNRTGGYSDWTMDRINKIIIAVICVLFLPGCIRSPWQNESYPSPPIVSPANTDPHIELPGTRWVLQSMHGQGLLERPPITLKIAERGISGFSGCNLYSSAEYTIKPKNRIENTEVAHTDMGCPTGLLEQQEIEYINTLPKATNYRLSGENLFMMDEQGNVLLQYRLLPKFEANPEGLIVKIWRLHDADGMEGYEFEAFTLWFDGSTFGGTTSCRDYKGTYRTDEDIMAVTTFGMTTDIECTQKEQNAENTYTTLLERIDQYNVSENQLELYTVQNDKLIYELVPDE